MEAGKRRHYIEIQNYVTVQDQTSGDDVKVYSPFAHGWGSIKTLRGRELFTAQQEFAAADVEIEMPFIAGVDEKMRCLHDGIYYNILNVDDLLRKHKDMRMICETGISETK